jgi:hypothetical protein
MAMKIVPPMVCANDTMDIATGMLGGGATACATMMTASKPTPSPAPREYLEPENLPIPSDRFECGETGCTGNKQSHA